MENTLPLLAISKFNILNSIGVTLTIWPSTLNSFVDVFNSKPPLINTSLLPNFSLL